MKTPPSSPPRHNSARPVVRRRWSEVEDNYLLTQMKYYEHSGKPVNWSEIAAILKTRSNKDCRKRYIKISPQFSKGAWQGDEDARLRAAVETNSNKWKAVSDLVQTRSPDQCAKRWRNSLDPNIIRSNWSAQEDTVLLNAVQQLGRVWKDIQQKYLPARSRLDLSNRYTILNRKVRGSISWGPSHIDPSQDSIDDEEEQENSDGGFSPLRVEPPSRRHMRTFSWEHNDHQHHNLLASPQLSNVSSVDTSGYVAQDTHHHNYMDHQHMQQHMSYPSYFAENPSWMATNKDHLSVPAGYPTSMVDTEPNTVGTSSHQLLAPKIEPYHSPYQSPQHSPQNIPQQISKQTIHLDNYDPPARAAILSTLVDSKRNVTLLLD